MPTTSPRELTSGPPELPGFIEASVWIASGMLIPPSSIVRLRALTTPLVTVGPPGRLRAWPMAITSSPTRRSSDLPSGAAFRLFASMSSTARSVGGSTATSRTSKVRPSLSVTSMRDAPATTWLLVTIVPSSSMMKPVPTELSAWMWTTEGRSRSTSSTVGIGSLSCRPSLDTASAGGRLALGDGGWDEAPPPQAAKRTRARRIRGARNRFKRGLRLSLVSRACTRLSSPRYQRRFAVVVAHL